MPRHRSPVLRRLLAAIVAIGLVVGLAPGASGRSPSAAPAAPTRTKHTVAFDHYSFTVDGKRVYLWSGEFHYFRLPSPSLWTDIFQKMRAAGFNSVSLYFDWGYHSPAPGKYDFSGVRDVDRLLDEAERAGLFVIARPAPYINAEVDSGGLPTWLSTKDVQNRSDDPNFLRYANEWLTRIDRIIKRHQLTNGTGSVIAYQVENEFYDGSAAGNSYIARLRDKARADGITVPLTGNNNGTFNSGAGKLDVDGPDAYPQGFDCSNPQTWRGVPDLSYDHPDGRPLYTPEFQGGAFDPWGGPGYDKCAELINDKFANVFYKQNIAVGSTAQNFYMTYGGTNWGWLGMPQNYTSYDYGAAIRETRQLDPKFYEDKLIGYFTQSVAPLTKTDAMTSSAPTNAAIVDTARKNPDSGTQFHVLRHKDSTSTAVDDTHIAFEGSGLDYPSVPQQAGTAITLDGRDSKILVAGYDLGDARLQYSTSEIMTHAAIGTRDVAVLYGNKKSAGETVLRYATRPSVTNSSGVKVAWDESSGDLRLNYTHSGLRRVLIEEPGQRPLLLLLADKPTAETFWRQDTSDGPVLVRGSHLLRTATSEGGTLALTGDNGSDPSVEVFADAGRITWNGKRLQTVTDTLDGRTGAIATAARITLPALDSWRVKDESPEASADFDDSSWQVADKRTTNSSDPVANPPVLYADDYGFHTGNTWYRGRFRATGKETGISLASDSGGKAQAFSAWLNGKFVGSSTTGSADLTFPSGALRSGDNVLSVLTVNMGHEEDYNATNGNRASRGLKSASLLGAPLTSVTWRVQGVRGGEDQIDPVRGPLSTGGLYGERAGWSLPGYPDRTWTSASLPRRSKRAGVSWYRDVVNLDLPKGQDTSLGLTIKDDPSRKYRATLFVNGWQLGNYVNYLGPQHTFPVPNGTLKTHGRNTIAIAVWNLDGSSGGLGKVSLTNYGSYASPLQVTNNDSPGYDRAKYAIPPAPTAGVSLITPQTVRGGESFTASATVSVPAGAARATSVRPRLTAPAGWTVGAPTPSSVPSLRPGGTARFTWTVTAPAKVTTSAALTASVRLTQRDRTVRVTDERIVGWTPDPPAAGTVAVSDLPFLTATNGWGPVERDTSNGEQPAGDGKPITIAGTGYTKGLGTNAPSDVRVYLGGSCTHFTAKVGVDDETKGAGTVTFTVQVDGKTVATSETLRGGQTAATLDADITSGQVLDLVVGDAGDGNGNDHGDWAVPTLTCG